MGVQLFNLRYLPVYFGDYQTRDREVKIDEDQTITQDGYLGFHSTIKCEDSEKISHRRSPHHKGT